MKITKKLKTTQKTVLEKCEFVAHSTKLKLLGCELACDDLKQFQKANPNFTCECNGFETNLGLDSTFYYQLLHLKSQNIVFIEVGLGELEQIDGQLFLKRVHALYNQTPDGNISPNPLCYHAPMSDPDEYLHIAHFNISNAIQLFLHPNTIPYASENGPAVLYPETNNLIGRLDGDLQPIEITELFSLESFTNRVLETVSGFSKAITLKTTKLYSKLINTTTLVLSSTKPTSKSPKGSLIYDDDEKCLKFFDGSAWKRIAHEDT